MNISTEKDAEQDQMIRDNAVRITRNEEAIKRQTDALEQIRDHYYPPPDSFWKKSFTFTTKVLCCIVAYLSVSQAMDWIWNARVSAKLAGEYAAIGRRLFFADGNAAGAMSCYEKAVALDSGESDYSIFLSLMKGMALTGDLMGVGRPLTEDESARVASAWAEVTVLRQQAPDDPLPCVMMAQLFLIRGEREAAVREIVGAVERHPDKASLRVSACAIHFFAGKVAEARTQLEAAERLDGSLPLICLWKGFLALNGASDPAVACARCEETVCRFPQNPLAQAIYGKALLAAAGKKSDAATLAKARQAFAKALTYAPKNRLALAGMAESHLREGRFAVARVWLDRALRLDANNIGARIARSRVYERLGDRAAAIADLTAAVELAPLRVDFYRMRAAAYEKAGDAVRAAADRRVASELESGTPTP